MVLFSFALFGLLSGKRLSGPQATVWFASFSRAMTKAE
jgi:hypothetical protein